MEGGYDETEVRLDEWFEGGLRQQRNDGGSCASMRERSDRVESPGGRWLTPPPSRALVDGG